MQAAVTILGAACALAVAVAATLAWQPPAQSQMRVTPALQTVGAAAGAATTAWFQDPSNGRVVACHSTLVNGVPDIKCASAALP